MQPEVDPAEDGVQGEPVARCDLPAAVQVGPGQPDVAGLQMHEAAIVEHLDQVQWAGLGQQGHRLVVLPQRQVVAPAALEQEAALGQQDRSLRPRDVLLSLVKQPEADVHPPAFGLGPGQADQQPAADLGDSRVAAVWRGPDQPQPRAQLAHGRRGPSVIARGQGGRVQPGGPVRERGRAHVRG
jgi:hypothetical protein